VRRGFNLDREIRKVELTVRAVGGGAAAQIQWSQQSSDEPEWMGSQGERVGGARAGVEVEKWRGGVPALGAT
jgi:hypothetical protein